MHVLHEGVLEYEVKMVLQKACPNKRLFGIFNVHMNTFFQGIKGNSLQKPAALTWAGITSDDKKLHQSASKMLSVARAMPFVLPSVLERGDDLLVFMQELLEISNILLAPVLQLATTQALRELVSIHLKNFRNTFPECTIIPKQHCLIHIATDMEQYGPVVHISTNRFESNHRAHKRKIVIKQNFKNVPKSVAEACMMEDSVMNEKKN
jgi:hypothetical protein